MISATFAAVIAAVSTLVGVVLGQVVTTHLVAYTRSYDRLYEAITSVYGELTKLHRSFIGWSTADPDYSLGNPTQVKELSEEYLREKNVEQFNVFLDVYYPQSIWLSRGIRDDIEEYTQRAKRLREAFLRELSTPGWSYNTDIQRKRKDQMNKQLAQKHEQIRAKLQEELEAAREPWWSHLFARLLGQAMAIAEHTRNRLRQGR